jgi:glycosidase
MEFHINRSIRKRLALGDTLFAYNGNVLFANVSASRKLAQGLNELRGQRNSGEDSIHGGALFAMGLIDELSHAMVALYRKQIDPAVLSEAMRWYEQRLGRKELDRLLLAFTEEFPGSAVYRGELTAAKWLAGSTESMPNREAALEELMLLWLANLNPAFKPFRELFDETALRQSTAYTPLTASLPAYFATRPKVSKEAGTLIEALQAPMLASPDSLIGQLEFIRASWAPLLGSAIQRTLLAIDIVREEDVAIWMRFHPPTGGPQHGIGKWEAHGFVGDEYVGFDEDFILGPDGRRRPRYATDYQAALNEYEAFSPDQAWMPNVVMMAKNTYVWLEQLSRKYQRHIHRLDQIPDEELRLLADRGMTALWLIGLWERSSASRTIKRLRGSFDAVASAYSLKEYDIADDLGGNGAYENLRDRASRFGLRLASDMVPNHMGIDSPWVIEHPEWFIQRWDPPFPSYRFDGPDLSSDSRAEIKIEDHYYDQTDAAVAFRLRTHADGTTRYIYHGNDGTTFAWNDTAQLDYSKAAVREHVIQVILHVARRFPIIRFDAAMVLAKRHVQRLWFPLPGVGGSIPSRAENAMSQEEFDALMPNEFWREVVDRVAVEVPGTLLLAEAFWLLEGYFVRTLGMHRVYNSAFMNMLRDEENAKYRSYLKKTIEFDPDIMKRYVNFMSNPDERTAIDQFGDGDKYFGTCVLLATLPGLPMFAHGQIEGFTERYGMDFKEPRMQEWPNQGLIDRYQREITPLLKKRYVFAESDHFVLYDLWLEHGVVDENVIAYSNRCGDERALVAYNNAYPATRGTLHISAASFDKGSGQLVQRSLSDALGLPTDDAALVAYRDPQSNLEYLRRASELRDHGISFELRGFQYIVLQQWRTLYASAEWPWDQLCDELRGAGAPSIDEAMITLRLRAVHASFADVLREAHVNALIAMVHEAKVAASDETPASDDLMPAEPSTATDVAKNGVSKPKVPAGLDPLPVLDARLEAMLDACHSFYAQAAGTHLLQEGAPQLGGFPRPVEAVAADAMRVAARVGGLPQRWSTTWQRVEPTKTGSVKQWAEVVAAMTIAGFPGELPRAAIFDRLRLRNAVVAAMNGLGIEGEEAWRAAARVRVLLAWGAFIPAVESDAFWTDSDVRWLLDIHDAGDIAFFGKERFEDLVAWLYMAEPITQMGEYSAAVATEDTRPLPVKLTLEELGSMAAASGYQVEALRKLIRTRGETKLASVTEDAKDLAVL